MYSYTPRAWENSGCTMERTDFFFVRLFFFCVVLSSVMSVCFVLYVFVSSLLYTPVKSVHVRMHVLPLSGLTDRCNMAARFIVPLFSGRVFVYVCASACFPVRAQYAKLRLGSDTLLLHRSKRRRQKMAEKENTKRKRGGKGFRRRCSIMSSGSLNCRNERVDRRELCVRFCLCRVACVLCTV